MPEENKSKIFGFYRIITDTDYCLIVNRYNRNRSYRVFDI